MWTSIHELFTHLSEVPFRKEKTLFFFFLKEDILNVASETKEEKVLVEIGFQWRQ